MNDPLWLDELNGMELEEVLDYMTKRAKVRVQNGTTYDIQPILMRAQQN